MYRRFDYSGSSNGGGDKCSKGKSCGAACIYRNNECVVDLPPNIGAALQEVSRLLSGRIDSGVIEEKNADLVIDAIKDDEKALKKFGDLIKSGKASEDDKEGVADFLVSVTMVPKQDRNAARTLSYDQLEGINKRGLEKFEEAAAKSIGKDGKFDPNLPGGMNDLIKNQFLTREVSDEAAAAAYAMLPTNVKTSLNKAGAVAAGKAFDGYDEQGNIQFGDGNKVRGVFLVKRWMEQGGKDPYTGERIDIRNAEPEHLFSFDAAKKTGVSGDQPGNLLWSAPAPNNLKKEYTFPKFKSVVQDALSLGREKYTKEVYQAAQARSAGTKKAKTEAAGLLGEALNNMTPKDRAEATKKLLDTYGGDRSGNYEARYLFRAAGLKWQFQEKNPAQRVGGRPGFINTNVESLGSLKAKPAKAILVAMSVIDEQKRERLKSTVNNLLSQRVLSGEEVNTLRSNPEQRKPLQSARDKKFAQDLEAALLEEVPDLGNYL